MNAEEAIDPSCQVCRAMAFQVGAKKADLRHAAAYRSRASNPRTVRLADEQLERARASLAKQRADLVTHTNEHIREKVTA